MSGVARKAVRWRMEDAARTVRLDMSRGVWVLRLIAGVAPMVGGTGASVGIANCFRGISGEGSMFWMVLALGEAIWPFVPGLALATACLMAHQWIIGQLDDVAAEMEIATCEVVSLLEGSPR